MGVTVVIISAGTLDNPARITAELHTAPPPVVICADGGARYAKELGIVPQVIIGDMDSIDEATLAFFEAKGSALMRHETAKNQTDTELALIHAVDLKPERIIIFGALGSRMDHSLANIMLLASIVPAAADVRIIDDRCEIFTVTDEALVRGDPGQTVSLLPLSPVVSGVTLEGFEYPLRDGEIAMGRSLGISNRLVGTEGFVTVQFGRLLIINNFIPEVSPGGTGKDLSQ